MQKLRTHIILSAATLFAGQFAQAGSLTISEVLYNEVGSAFAGEWIEIYNGTDAAIDLSDYKIGDEETRNGTTETEVMSQFPAGSIIAPGAVQILASFSSRFQEVYGFRPTYEYGSSVEADGWIDDEFVPNMTVYSAWDPDGAKLNMSNTNDQVLFLDGNDAAVDAVNWGNTVFLNPGVSASAGDGQSVARNQTDVDTNVAADWSLTLEAPTNVFWTTRSTPGTVNLAPLSWSGDDDGSFSDALRFTAESVENTYGRVVRFGGAIAANRTVTLDADQTVYAIHFDNAAAGYTLAGASTLTVDSSFGGGKLVVASGSHTISAPVAFGNAATIDVASKASLRLTGSLSAANASIRKTGAGAVSLPGVRAKALAVDEGRVEIAAASPAAGTSVLKSLSVAAGAVLDLGEHAVVVDYDAESNPLAEVTAMVVDGRIASSVAAADSRKAIGIADTASLTSLTSIAGVALDGTAVVARVTYKGDTNLDQAVDFSDLLALAQNYNSGSGSWTTGDFNRDAQVNFEDLLALAQNYGASGSVDAIAAAGAGEQFVADWSLAVSLAPEPASLSVLLGGAALLRRRR